MRVLALACVLLFGLMAGCSDGSGDSFFTEKGRPAPAPVDDGNVTQELPKGEIVDIQESGDVLTGVDQDWPWEVAPGFTRFNVRVSLEGFQGSPAQLAAGFTATLTGGLGNETVHIDQNGGTVSLNGGTSGTCVLCYDGVVENAPAGPWRLAIYADGGLAGWSVTVDVEY